MLQSGELLKWTDELYGRVVASKMGSRESDDGGEPYCSLGRDLYTLIISDGTIFPFPEAIVVNDVKVRRNSLQWSNCALKVRSIQKPHGWNRFWSRPFDVKDENLYYVSSSEKRSVAWKEAGHWKWCRTFNAKKLPSMFDVMALNPVFSFDPSGHLPFCNYT